eukprot:GDKK01027949.1.p1 GENE.GDKK01027949.1~~GDKK01027949.1.p1  ORF type:complete len:463 (+),score=69.32 GDKK01027949.1:68-1456(+)
MLTFTQLVLILTCIAFLTEWFPYVPLILSLVSFTCVMVFFFEKLFDFIEGSSTVNDLSRGKKGVFDLTHILLNVDVSLSQWGNLGFWDKLTPALEKLISTNANNYITACERLATLIYSRAQLYKPMITAHQKHVVDVGVGCGDQVKMLQRQTHEYFGHHLTIEAINLSTVQTEAARKRVPKKCSNGFCSFHASVGSATDLLKIYNNDSDFADVVTAIDTAYHFDSREDFIAQSSHILKQGGHLSFSDVAFSKGRLHFLLKWLLPKLCSIPSCNLWAPSEISSVLSTHGFDNILIEDISKSVVSGFPNWLDTHQETLRSAGLKGNWFKYKVTSFLMRWGVEKGVLGYYLISAKKKRKKMSSSSPSRMNIFSSPLKTSEDVDPISTHEKKKASHQEGEDFKTRSCEEEEEEEVRCVSAPEDDAKGESSCCGREAHDEHCRHSKSFLSFSSTNSSSPSIGGSRKK